jgi:outer membrane murein-binding lipoprotein Lpp
MIKNIVVIALAALALGVFAPTARAEQYDDLAVKVVELQKDLGNLEALVKNLTYDVQQSQGFGAILKQLSFEMKKTEASIGDLMVFEKRVNVEVFPTLMNLQTSVAGLITATQEKLDAMAGRVFTVETSVDQLSVRVSTLEERTKKLLELQDRVAKLEEMIAQLSGQKPGVKTSEEIQKINASVRALEDKVNQMAADQHEVTVLKRQVEDARDGSGFATFLGLLGIIAGVVAFIFAVDP